MTHAIPTSPVEEPRSVATIGVYGFDIETFLATLAAAQVVTVFDVRQRRGVRGPQYSWANSRRLQAALAGAGLAYEHHPELAPTTELRHVQYDEDTRQGVGKRSTTLLCVEADPEACHRSLIAARIAAQYHATVTHLRP